MTSVQTNSAQFIGRKRLDIEVIEFQSDDLYGACEAVAPFLGRLVLVSGWAFRVLMNLPNNEPTNNRIPFTKDADFAVQLSVKSDFEDIRAHLLQSGFQNRDKLLYSFQKEGRIVEIIPFGVEARAITEFELPEYQLAFEDNHPLVVRNKEKKQLSLRAISVATMVVHKIFAYTDRPMERRKDLDHLAYLLEYFGNEEEKYGLIVKKRESIEEQSVIYELTSAHLLGREFQQLINNPFIKESRTKLQKIIHEIERREIETENSFLQRLNILMEYLEDKYEQ